MCYQDHFNSERYIDMTAFLAIRNVERQERKKTMEATAAARIAGDCERGSSASANVSAAYAIQKSGFQSFRARLFRGRNFP